MDGNALVVLIQLLDEKIVLLKKQVDSMSAEDDNLAELEDELLIYTKVEGELRAAYERALEGAGNLPPYADLVHNLRVASPTT